RLQSPPCRRRRRGGRAGPDRGGRGLARRPDPSAPSTAGAPGRGGGRRAVHGGHGQLPGGHRPVRAGAGPPRPDRHAHVNGPYGNRPDAGRPYASGPHTSGAAPTAVLGLHPPDLDPASVGPRAYASRRRRHLVDAASALVLAAALAILVPCPLLLPGLGPLGRPLTALR